MHLVAETTNTPTLISFVPDLLFVVDGHFVHSFITRKIKFGLNSVWVGKLCDLSRSGAGLVRKSGLAFCHSTLEQLHRGFGRFIL
jgi:hypothetical protein